MSNAKNFYSGFNDLSKEIEDYLKNVENVQDVLEVGAKKGT